MNQHMDDVLGGSEIQCDLIAKNLTKFGHDVFYGAIRSKKTQYNETYQVIPIKKFSIIKYCTILDNVQPDIVYWRYNTNFLLKAGLIGKIKRHKLVFSISHVNDVIQWNVSRPVKYGGNLIKRIIKYILLKKKYLTRGINHYGYYFVDGVVSLKRDLLSMLPKRFDNNRKEYIPNSMYIKIEKEFKWSKHYIVWVANIKKPKNPEKYIELASSLRDLNVDFLMIGKIQDNYYNYILDKDKLPPNIKYLGAKKVHEVDEILTKSLFMVHTCNPEGFGNNFIQAWLLGKPTISLYFDPDGIIEENDIGYLSGTVEQMKEHVLELINNEKLRINMGNRAKKMAEKMFDPENNSRKFEDFFQKILENRRDFWGR